MAKRHLLALQSNDTTDLIELAEMLTIAVNETIEEEKIPFQDPAVRFIAFQIAFAGNGDLPFREYYVDIYNYCVTVVGQDQIGVPIKEENKPNEPVYKAS